ncbi:hypothetical protein L226DRAFT_531833 [Lentinus tigrinus ALCF2SS1-7]|uniref:uncharacterized protein n=1 Tax=Lentinus tigrinus ALCF2SS1-7 TaxID=1328758 RepID=UPI001165DA09|nr:hypothetical protein L226DRAFT_531833 [Lentinus tigrinus ALCF2SS1-7]
MSSPLSLTPSLSISSQCSRRRQAGQDSRTPKRRRASESTSTTGSNYYPTRLARPACPENSLPKEVFETRFENPLKAIGMGLGQKQKRVSNECTTFPAQRQPRRVNSPLKSVKLRVMLSSLRLTFTPARLDNVHTVSPVPGASSQSTRISTDSSASETPHYVRNGIRRTNPYGPPYYACAPGYDSSQNEQSCASSISSFDMDSLALSASSSISACEAVPPVSPSPNSLSAAAAIAEAVRRGRL